MMLAMVLCFALMNATFISAQALGTAANAILLQNSAPLWMYLAAIFWLGDAPDRRGTISLFVGLVGIGIIVAGGWTEGELLVVGIGLASGFTYAGVILGLRILRDVPSNWLTVWNHLIGGLVLVPFLLFLHPPTWQQYVVLFLFGAIQLGLPYYLMAHGLRVRRCHGSRRDRVARTNPQSRLDLARLRGAASPLDLHRRRGHSPGIGLPLLARESHASPRMSEAIPGGRYFLLSSG